MTNEQIRSFITTNLWLAAIGLAATDPKFCRQHVADAVEIISGFWAPDLVPDEDFCRFCGD